MVADTGQIAAITSRSAGESGRNGGEWAERVKTLYNVGSDCYNRLGSARAATGQEKPMISRFRWGICGLVAITLSLAWVEPATASSDVKTVNYRGYQLDVPRSWPVYDLARTPSSCIRFDRHAVYLGAATAAQTCPAHLVGQTEALWIAPLGVVPAGASILRPGRATPTTMPVSAGHRSSFVVRSAGVLVNASYGADRGAIGAILASGRLTAGDAAGLRAGYVRRLGLRCLRRAVRGHDAGLGRLAVSRNWRLYRRNQPCLRAGEPHLLMGLGPGCGRVAHAPDLCRVAGPVQRDRVDDRPGYRQQPGPVRCPGRGESGDL